MTAPSTSSATPTSGNTRLPDQALWPADDVLILRSRPVRIGAPPSRMSRFGDELWHVQPAHRDAHLQISAISWSSFPAALRQHFRTFFLAALDHPVPVEPGGRQRPAEQASIGSFPYWVIDMRVLALWLDEQGFHDLSEVRDADLETFRTYVLGLDRDGRRKSDLITAVRLLWLFSAHMPSQCRLDCDFPWAGQTAKEVVGAPAGAGRENKTPRIADDTMEALLAWVLVMIEEIGPDIRDAWHEYQQIGGWESPLAGPVYRHTGGTASRIPFALPWAGHCPARPRGRRRQLRAHQTTHRHPEGTTPRDDRAHAGSPCRQLPTDRTLHRHRPHHRTGPWPPLA